LQKSLWNQDGLAGLMFIAFGVFGLWFGRGYGMGTAMRMGPGAVPLLLSAGMILFGALITLRGFTAGGEPVAALRLRPILAILAGLAAFTLLLETAGLPLAAFACVGIGAFAGGKVRIGETIILALVLSAATTAIFVVGLGMPLKFWP
jgi:hypothetical protein